MMLFNALILWTAVTIGASVCTADPIGCDPELPCPAPLEPEVTCDTCRTDRECAEACGGSY